MPSNQISSIFLIQIFLFEGKNKKVEKRYWRN